mgnify:FL=1
MKNRILLLLWFLLLAAASVFTGAWVYAILLLLSGLALAGFLILSIFCGKNLSIELKLPKAAEQNGIWKGRLTLTNHSVLPVFLGKGTLLWENEFTGEKGEMPIAFSLGGKGKQVIEIQGRSQWCGCIRFALNSWKSFDFFGICSRKRKTELCSCTVVMPEKQKQDFSFLTKEGFDMESFRYSGSRPGDDPGETFDIREYREGDSIRQIHWKLTGKMDRLMIREKSFPVDDTVLILAEAFLPEKDPGTAQTLAEVFAAVLSSFMEQGISCQAGVYDGSTGRFYIEKLRIQEDYENILYLFLRHGGEGDGPRMISEYLQNPGQQRFANYIYITGIPEEEELRRLRTRGEVTVVGCGIATDKGETITWKYGSRDKSKQKNIEDTCQVSCWKLS